MHNKIIFLFVCSGYLVGRMGSLEWLHTKRRSNWYPNAETRTNVLWYLHWWWNPADFWCLPKCMYVY